MRIAKLEPHLMHVGGYLSIADRLTINEWLFSYNLELTVAVASESKHCEPRFRKISVVEGDAVKSKDWLYEVIKADRLDERGTMVIDLRLTAFCYLVAQDAWQFFVHLLRPHTHTPCPLLYSCFLLRSALALSFVVAECRWMSAI